MVFLCGFVSAANGGGESLANTQPVTHSEKEFVAPNPVAALAPQSLTPTPTPPAQPIEKKPSPPTLADLQLGLEGQQNELNQVQSALEQLRQTIEQVKLDRNEAKISEARMREAITQEADNFLSGQTDTEASNRLRSDYVSTKKKRQELDEEYQALMQFLKLDQQKAIKLKAEISQRQIVLEAMINTRDKRIIHELRNQLPTKLEFTQAITFTCPTSKGLSNCLAQKDIAPLVHGKINSLYAQAVKKIRVQKRPTQPGPINDTEFSYTFTHSFESANMGMDGKVSAMAKVDVTVRPSSSLACSYLGVNQSLCSAGLYMLTVRSNKNGDQVVLAGVNYGSTPLVLALPKGDYDIQVAAEGAQQKRMVQLSGDKAVNFKF
jgi:hypothetical protein